MFVTCCTRLNAIDWDGRRVLRFRQPHWKNGHRRIVKQSRNASREAGTSPGPGGASSREKDRPVSDEFVAILILAGIVGPLQILILGLLWNLAGRLGKVEGLLQGLLAERSPPARG